MGSRAGQFIRRRDSDLRLYLVRTERRYQPSYWRCSDPRPRRIGRHRSLAFAFGGQDGHLEKFDTALSFCLSYDCTNEDTRCWLISTVGSSEKATGNGSHVQHIVAQTERKVAIIIPNSFLFGPGRIAGAQVPARQRLESGSCYLAGLGLIFSASISRPHCCCWTHENVPRGEASSEYTEAHFIGALTKGRGARKCSSDRETFASGLGVRPCTCR